MNTQKERCGMAWGSERPPNICTQTKGHDGPHATLRIENTPLAHLSSGLIGFLIEDGAYEGARAFYIACSCGWASPWELSEHDVLRYECKHLDMVNWGQVS